MGDSRGVRVSAVRLTAGSIVAYYDGRASAAENYEERTGIATGPKPTALTAHGPIAQSPYGEGGLRYLSILDLGESGERYYYETARTSCAPSCADRSRASEVAASEVARLAVARLALARRPCPDQPAGVAARLQPVAEVLAGDGFQEPDVGLEQGEQVIDGIQPGRA